MKKNLRLKFVAILTVSTLLACTQDAIDSLPMQAESEQSMAKSLSKYRSYGEALAIAQDAIEMLGEEWTTRSGKPRTIKTSDVQYVINNSFTRSAETLDTLMYVFNFEDNAGFAVVSANRATEELIAVTERGNYIAGEDTENDGFNMYMDMARVYIESANTDSLTPFFDPTIPVDFQVVTTRTVLTNYGPFVKVRWGQGFPYNVHCFDIEGNQAVAGCVATAIAQILSYYRHPNTIQLTYEEPTNIFQLDWDDINTHKQSSTCLSCASHSASIGKLFRQIGEYVDMTYGASSSSGHTNYAYKVFDAFGYSYGVYQAYNTSTVINSLSKNQVVLMRGGDVDGKGSHAWVLDGYQYVKIDKTSYTRPEGEELWIENETHTSYAAYNHLNWGWNGGCNGYYLTNVFDTQAYGELDFGVPSGADFNFSESLKMYPYISIKQ